MHARERENRLWLLFCCFYCCFCCSTLLLLDVVLVLGNSRKKTRISVVSGCTHPLIFRIFRPGHRFSPVKQKSSKSAIPNVTLAIIFLKTVQVCQEEKVLMKKISVDDRARTRPLSIHFGTQYKRILNPTNTPSRPSSHQSRRRSQ